jgi:molybdate transport system substrate-binding protein
MLLTAAVLILAAVPARAAGSEDQAPLVYAAASLTEVLQQIGADFSRAGQQHVKFSFASTATLARQIEAGAPADLFISADQEWMDYLAARNSIRVDSRVDLLGNSLVLIAPADARATHVEFTVAAFAAALGDGGRIALADPASVPAGRYAKAALVKLGLWDRYSSRTVAADNVRAALQFVARGEAPLGIVYATDAYADRRVRVVAKFAADSHPPIMYPAALTTRAVPAAAQFLEYLSGPQARARFEAAGFRVLGANAAAAGQAPNAAVNRQF